MTNKSVKYIFITGGVVSSLGKGILSASIGALLKAYNLRVTIQKYDPYINVDPGTMSPYQHGEVFVTDDGAETDLDLGHYERFLGESTSQKNNITMGKVYQNVIEKERMGKYLGQTVQIIPHVIDEIKTQMTELARTKAYDIIITEIGGTVGDIESLPFLEAMRQLRLDLGSTRVLNFHLTLVPFIKTATELKTKPTQHSVRQLLELGIQPDALFCRSEHPLPKDIKKKIGMFCNLESKNVISFNDIQTIYEAPIVLSTENVEKIIFQKLKIHPPQSTPSLDMWKNFSQKVLNPTLGEVRVGLCGKYTEYPDAYKSIIEAFIHAGVENDVKVKVVFINSETMEKNNVSVPDTLQGLHGILIAPGFGERGIEGKLKIIEYVRNHNIPMFGICLGMQCMVIEFARNVCQLEKAHSTEFDKKAKHAVVDIMKTQRKIEQKGATMRLGSYPCVLEKSSKIYEAYQRDTINERHRHRYEFNNAYREIMTSRGLFLSGISPDGELIEAIELPSHRWFIGVQFHPELKSRVAQTHPLFRSFVKALREFRNKE